MKCYLCCSSFSSCLRNVLSFPCLDTTRFRLAYHTNFNLLNSNCRKEFIKISRKKSFTKIIFNAYPLYINFILQDKILHISKEIPEIPYLHYSPPIMCYSQNGWWRALMLSSRDEVVRFEWNLSFANYISDESFLSTLTL